MSMAEHKIRTGLTKLARLDRLAWYYHRLRAMDGAEVTHRFGEAVKRRLSRLDRSGCASFDKGDGALPGLVPPAGRLDALAPELLDTLRQATQGVRCDHVSLLGQTWPAMQGSARFHLDPSTGKSWPHDVYCFDIGYRRERGLGDIKYVWEFNRLQHLQPLAALACHDRDDELANFCLDEIESWIDANPPFFGVNWASGVELALRIVSILVVLGLIGTECVQPALRRKIRACLAAHAYWLARYPSRHSSANNHTIAEAGALFLLGTLSPELGVGGKTETARALLIEQVERQIHGDGVGAEQSPTYTAFTLEWYLLCVEVAKRAGRPFPQSVTRRLAAAGKYLRAITDEGGHLPRIGDDDEGRVLATGLAADPDYVSSVLGCLAASLDRPELAPPAVRPALRNLYLGLSASHHSSYEGATLFAEGGYSVFRRTIAGRRTLMVMDHGPLGHLSIAAHGHADALALWLHIGDQPVLVDAGTYLYHSGGAWRDHLRGTPLHNTLSLDERNSSRIAGPFNWGRRATSSVLAWKDTDAETYTRACHDGYRQSHGLLHERQVIAHERGFTVRDALIPCAQDVLARSELPFVEIGFLVHPDLDVRANGVSAVILSAGEPLLRIAGNEALGLDLFKGCSNPARGWYSQRFGSIAPASQLVFRPFDRTARSFEIALDILPGATRRHRDTRAT